MGEVYRARDTRLKRDVALKILPESFASDPDRLARFQREAEVLASLNHPHIAAIYGIEEEKSDVVSGFSRTALVLELVEGETLADRIARGPIPVEEALPIARQIAEALEAAHGQGVIHRDLKPANVKVTPDGVVKVLDFGLARLAVPEAAGAAPAALSMSPTISPAMMTGAGVILGTAAYMSPEQAKGRSADQRSDIWSFGCLLYELLTGRRAFAGADMSDTLVAIMRDEPDWSALPPALPAPVRTLVVRCLAKDRLKRIADISVAQYLLDQQADVHEGHADQAPRGRPPMWPRIAVAASIALAAAAAAAGGVWMMTRTEPPGVVRLAVATSPASAVSLSVNDRDVVLSPDGRRIAYVGQNGTVFVRELDRLESTRLGAVSARNPFFSPDGEWVGYFDGAVKKVAATGGPPMTLTTIDGTPRGAAWGEDGRIVFATNNLTTGLWSVPESGGEGVALTKPNREAGEADHLWPEFLPGGRGILFTITPFGASIDESLIAVLDLETGAHKIVVRGGSHAQYAASGHLVYGIAGTLRAVAFDLDRLEPAGASLPVISDVITTQFGAANYAIARNGTVAYMPGGTGAVSRIPVWVDRDGREEPLGAPVRTYQYVRIAPDGTRVAFDIRDQQGDIWIWEFARKTLARLTFDPTPDRFPVWTPDSRRVLFAGDRPGVPSLFLQPADGSGAAERLTEPAAQHLPDSISPDGTRAIFRETSTSSDLMMLSLDGDRRIQPLVATSFTEQNGRISPDGRWFAYESNASGQFEIYVRSFPDAQGAQAQVSIGGGSQALWARDGRELFYLSLTGALMRVAVEPGAQWSAGTPIEVFGRAYYHGGAPSGGTGVTYDISPDGLRFLMIKSGAGADQANTAPANIVVVLNWTEELKRLVPTR